MFVEPLPNGEGFYFRCINELPAFADFMQGFEEEMYEGNNDYCSGIP